MTYDEAVIYCRISPGARGGSGVKLEDQEKDARELAATLGKSVRAVYADKDISAAQRKKPRKDYLRMLRDLQGAPADVIAWHADRIHRQPAELERYIDIVEPRQIVTYTVRASALDLATPSGRMVARMLGSAASFEVEHMQERQREAKKHAAEKGIPLGGQRPFGYSADGMSPCHHTFVTTAAEAERRGIEPDGVVATRRGDRVLITLPYDETDELKEAARKVVTGVSLHAIALDWNSRGVLTSLGYRWSRASEVRRVLAKPRNAGLMVHRGVTVGPAAWPALIDELTWRHMTAIFADPSRVTSPGPGRRWLGSGIYECGICEAPMTASSTTGHGQQRRKRTVYRCSSTRYLAVPDGRQHPARDATALDQFTADRMKAWLAVRTNVTRLYRPQPGTEDVSLELARVRGELDGLAADAGAERITRRQLAIASAPLMAREKTLETRAAAGGQPDITGGARLTGEEIWALLESDLDRRRVFLQRVFRVRVLPVNNGRPPGWKPGRPYFSRDAVEITERKL
jgi:site-specific DNA recombinase